MEKISIGYALEGSTRISALIRSILKYETLSEENFDLQIVDFKELIKAEILALNDLIESRNAKIQLKELPNQITCEPNKMGLVFHNLIHNGLIFNKSESPELIISGKEKNNHWLISIEDNGIGIAPEYFQQVFKVFHRLNDRELYSGAGMGLPICQKIVERHQGEIWLQSEEGNGTTFFLTIQKTLEKV